MGACGQGLEIASGMALVKATYHLGHTYRSSNLGIYGCLVPSKGKGPPLAE